MHPLRRCLGFVALWKSQNFINPKSYVSANEQKMESGGQEQDFNHSNDVVARLAKHVMTTVGQSRNLVFSPASINASLGLAAAGSDDVTKHQILSFLKSPSADHLCSALAAMKDKEKRSDLCLSVANGVWIDKYVSLKSSFKELLENSYKATCRQADFATKPLEVIDKVNAWADKNTKGLIKQLLSKAFHENIIRESKLILANAIYFKGSWRRKFEANLTKDGDFHLIDGKKVKVPFMSNHEGQYVERYDGFQVLKLPYVKDHRQFSMYIYLPDDKDGLGALLERMGSESGFLDNHIPESRIRLDAFKIPKFKISYDFEVSGILKEMGLTSPFEGGLTEMINVNSSSIDEEPYISSIYQKACIEVDEEGTEAAAVTAMPFRCITAAARRREEVRFEADHPFLFSIREDKSGVILFMGQVLHPTN